MDTEPITNPENQTEQKRLNVLVEKNKEELGGFALVKVGDAGYILQAERQKPMAARDWILFDYDDTLVATTEVKRQRLELYKDYLKRTGINITDQQVTGIMSMTDKFSRWEENNGEGKFYHVNTHMAALDWITDKVKENPENVEAMLSEVQTTLDRIKLQLTEEQQPQEKDPFYFRKGERKFILRGTDKMWSKDIEEIFTQSMINPPQYETTLGAVKDKEKPVTSIHRTNIGVFTYGDPYYQLLKVFELMKSNPDFPVSQIWLTRRPKGEFIVEAVEEKATSGLKQDYVPPELEDYPGEEIAYGSGYILSQTPHVVVMMDDNPKELSSILSANAFLRERTGSEFVVVRSKREGTKAQNVDWQVNTKYGEVDFTTTPFSPVDIKKTFLINRYLITRSNLGEDHKNTIMLKNQLQAAGITDIN